MTWVLAIAAALLAVAALLLIVRLTIGPTLLDRSVALDVLVAVTVCATALHIAHTGVVFTLPVLAVLAAFGMVSAVSVARYTSRDDDVDTDNGGRTTTTSDGDGGGDR